MSMSMGIDMSIDMSTGIDMSMSISINMISSMSMGMKMNASMSMSTFLLPRRLCLSRRMFAPLNLSSPL